MKDWIREFYRKSGYDDAMLDTQLLFPLPHGGFFTVECRDKAMVVMTAAAPGKELAVAVEDLARKLGYKKIVFETKRNPKAWERLLGYKLAGYVMEKELSDG